MSEATSIDSLFVRERHVLLARVDLQPILDVVTAHIAEHNIVMRDDSRKRFNGALAAFLLHCASRPRSEHLSWTINFQQPLLNIFLVGDTQASTITGRVFEENVKQSPEQNFYQEYVARNGETLRSHVTFTGSDPLIAAEQYYERSEQRPARFFQLSATEYAILSAHPDWDEAWFQAATLETVQQLEATETLAFLEQRRYRWHCGCSLQRLLQVIAPLMRNGVDELFQGDPEIEAHCPRCAAVYQVTRQAAEDYLANEN